LPDRWGTPQQYRDQASFDAACLPPGQAGEIVVSGAHVLSGNLHGAGDAETKIHVGSSVWHRTGDAGQLDAAGRLWLLGRAAAKIDDERGRLYPLTIEAAAAAHPNVRRCALIANRGRRVLCLELVPGKSLPSELAALPIDACLQLERIPLDRRHHAKVDYPALRRLLRIEP
jgi:acyl-CoA synthetase (AMP-forming)/AMP-acid ligase II